MRLIDADELRKCAIPCEIHNGALTDLCVPLYQIDNAPTVEMPKALGTVDENGNIKIELIRPQGEWIEKVETKQLGHGWLTAHEIVCSFCGGSGENDENIPQCWKFCPNCGADMRGEEP